MLTFASWEEGFIVPPGNPKSIRTAADLARRDVTIVNREAGDSARLLLDHKLAAAGIAHSRVKGYERMALSHLEVARMVGSGLADAGIGMQPIAHQLGLDFVPLQEERYDLVIPTPYLTTHPSLSHLLDTMVSRPFRSELEALGGYNLREIGKVRSLKHKDASITA